MTVTATNPPAKKFFPWWLPGLTVGGLAAIAAFAATELTLVGAGSHRARAIVRVSTREQETAKLGAPLFRSKELLARTLAEPGVVQLESVRQSPDPLADLHSRLSVERPSPDIVVFTLDGDDPRELKVLLEHLVRGYLEDANNIFQRERTDRKDKLSRIADSLRTEIEAMERQIELAEKASGLPGGQGEAIRLDLLQKRAVEADSECTRVSRTITRMDAEVAILTKQLADEGARTPPDPVALDKLVQQNPTVVRVRAAYDAAKEQLNKAADDDRDRDRLRADVERTRKVYEEERKAARADAEGLMKAQARAAVEARVRELATAVAVNRQSLESLKSERDALQKLISSSVGSGVGIESTRNSLHPAREQLAKIQTELTGLRVAAQLEERAEMVDEVTTDPSRTWAEWARAVGVPTAWARAVGFTLATALSLVGHVFRVLRRAS